MADRTRLQRHYEGMMRAAYPGIDGKLEIYMRNAFFAGALVAYKELTADPSADADLYAELESYRNFVEEQAINEAKREKGLQ